MPSECLLCTGHSAGHSEGAEERHPDPARSMHIWGGGEGQVWAAETPSVSPAGRHLLSLGTKGMRRLLTFTQEGWI